MLEGEIFVKGFLTFYHRQTERITAVSPATVVQANIRVAQVFQLHIRKAHAKAVMAVGVNGLFRRDCAIYRGQGLVIQRTTSSQR